jgi:hypothetical protein
MVKDVSWAFPIRLMHIAKATTIIFDSDVIWIFVVTKPPDQYLIHCKTGFVDYPRPYRQSTIAIRSKLLAGQVLPGLPKTMNTIA